ncbi:hypothetical protein MBLNU13_g01515t1 [Cladosporium sp. NU13]
MSPSMFGLFTAGLAALAPLVSAYTTPTGTEPKGNPISQPGLNTIVPVGQSFTITWEPTTEGTVSLVLLKGPAENLIPVYAIAEKIENSGSYTWDPKSTLEASEGAKGYGIQLIDDKTGQYQYTTQFGISNDHKEEAAPSSYAAAPSSYAAAPSAYASSAVSSAVESASSVVAPVHSTSAPVAAPVTTAAAPYTIPNNATAVHSAPISFSTGVAKPTGGNLTQVEPSTGSASNMAASFGGLVLAAGIAVFAL